MNAAFPTDPRQELETRIVALLLGEASPFEEAQLLCLIEQDPQLAAFYRDMQKTVGLLHEVARPKVREEIDAVGPAAVPANAPKLSPARRAALLATLQTSPSPATAPAARSSAAATPAKPPPPNPRSRIGKLMRQPIGPELHWALKLAALLALLALCYSLLLPALGTAKARSTRGAELNRQKIEQLERNLAHVETMTGQVGGGGGGAFTPPQGPAQPQPAFGGAVTPASPTPADTPTAVTSTRRANNVYLPSARLAERAAVDLYDRAQRLEDDLAKLEGQSTTSQPGTTFYFDADADSRGGMGGGSGDKFARTATVLPPPAGQPLPTFADAKDAMKRDELSGLAAAQFPPPPPAVMPPAQFSSLGLDSGQRLTNGRSDGLINVGTPISALGNLQRQSAMDSTWAYHPAQQNLAFETAPPAQPQNAAAEQFWKELPNLNVMVNTVQSLGRAPAELQEHAGEQLNENRALREYSARETGRKRLADQESIRELERLARQTAEQVQAAGWKSTAGGINAPAPPPAAIATEEKRAEQAAEAKKEAIPEQLETAHSSARGARPPAPGRDKAPGVSLAAAKPASEEALENRRAGASLPPLIHPPEVPTAPNSTVNFSTFSLNVSDVSFKTAAASLQAGQWPDPNSIRVEEFINAFHYRDPAPAPGARVSFRWEIARHPFAHQRDLLRFSIQTAALGHQAAQPSNLVVLLDNSGSMGRPDRVAIVNQALRVLANKLQPQDKLSVVAFARRAQLCVDGQPGQQAKEALQKVLQLNPEGGTDLGAGLDLAYQTALKHYHPAANNRVLLLTDGAANLGDVDPDVLKHKVVNHRQKGVALDCFGVGWEGLADDLLELLSRNGDGRYALLNDVEEAATEFAEKLAGALNVAAADVKTQVEFNPHRVTAYRQIGYARHQLTKEQFRDNTVDAAELAAAEAGNAMYVVQINPEGQGPLGVVRVRYRIPATGEYEERQWMLPYTPQPPPLARASPPMRLAASAALFGEYLARNPYAGEIQLKSLVALAGTTVKAFEPDPRPQQLVNMMQQALRLEGIQ